MATALARKLTGIEQDPFGPMMAAYLAAFDDYGAAMDRSGAILEKIRKDPEWPGQVEKFFDLHRAEYPEGDSGTVACYEAWARAKTRVRRRHKIVAAEQAEASAEKQLRITETRIVKADAGNSFFGAYAKLLVVCFEHLSPSHGPAENLSVLERLVWDATQALRASMPGMPFFSTEPKKGSK